MKFHVSSIRNLWLRRAAIVATFPMMMVLVIALRCVLFPLEIAAGFWTLAVTAKQVWSKEAEE